MALKKWGIMEATEEEKWFGNKTDEYTGIDEHYDYIRGSFFTCPEPAVAQSICVAIKIYKDAAQRIKCAIYRKSDNRLVGVTEEIVVDKAGIWWVRLNFPTPKPLLEKAEYALVAWGTVPVGICVSPMDVPRGRQAVPYDSFPDPWNPEVFSTKEAHLIYSTYTLLPVTVKLDINSSPLTGVPFTIDTISGTTPFSTSIESGTYTITMPETVTVNGTTYTFAGWADGPTERIRTINITSDTSLTANYTPVAVKHTVTVQSTPVTGVPVTVDGTSVGTTPISATVVEGNHTFVVPESVET